MSAEVPAARVPAQAPSGPRISLIVAMANNRVIGANNRLPWHLPGDLKLFKTLTMGHHIVMGRKTWESIGRLLPGRTTVIVTRQADYRAEGAIVARSLTAALEAAHGDTEVFVIGGAQIFEAALPRADRIYLTVVDAEIEGDTFMPEFSLDELRAISTQAYPPDDRNAFGYTLTVLDRTGTAPCGLG